MGLRVSRTGFARRRGRDRAVWRAASGFAPPTRLSGGCRGRRRHRRGRGVELGGRDHWLLTSVVPLAGLALATRSLRAALAAAALALLLGLAHHRSWLPGAVVLATAAILSRPVSRPLTRQRGPRPRRAARVTQAAAIAIGVAALAIAVQAAAAEREGELRGRLDEALVSRDRGELESALALLLALEREFPRAPAPVP